MGIHNEAQLDRKFLELAKLMNIYLNHFPSHEKYGLYKFNRAAKRARMESVVSILGHARRTHSHHHLVTTLRDNHHALYRQLPKTHRQYSHR